MIVLLLIAATGISGVVFGYTIVQPLAKAKLAIKSSTRFFVCDFFTLTFLISIPILFIATIRRTIGQDSPALFIVGLTLIGTFAYAWGRGATLLSAVGVVDSQNRCCFLGVILPIAILGSAIAVPMLILSGVALPRMSGWGVVLWLMAALATLAVAMICRMLTWRITRDGPRPDEIGRSSGGSTSHETEAKNL